jgi:hypothetical protein
MTSRDPHLQALAERARTGDEEAVEALAGSEFDEALDSRDLTDRIIFYPLSMQLPNHPTWFETYQVEFRGLGQTPFLGWIGRIGASSTWEFDDGTFSFHGRGLCESREEALIRLGKLKGIIEDRKVKSLPPVLPGIDPTALASLGFETR